jgi:predicted nucleic acid-binding protein
LRRKFFVDTSAFHALLNTADRKEHKTATQVAAELGAEGALLITTDYILDETYTLLRSAIGHRVAVGFGHEIQKDEIVLIQIDERIQQAAWSIFERYSDKRFSFTDCTSFAVMGTGKIETAFTFDGHFRQYGFQTMPRTWPLK